MSEKKTLPSPSIPLPKGEGSNPHAGRGGSYIRHADGTVTVNEAPTQDHPDGNAPRDAEGQRLDLPKISQE